MSTSLKECDTDHSISHWIYPVIGCGIHAEYMRNRPFNGLLDFEQAFPTVEELLPPVVWRDQKHEGTPGAQRLQTSHFSL